MRHLANFDTKSLCDVFCANKTFHAFLPQLTTSEREIHFACAFILKQTLKIFYTKKTFPF